MSIISSSFVVLLCFSFHACNARSLGVASTSKENEKLYPYRVSEKTDMKSSVPNASIGAKQEKEFEEKKANFEYNHPTKHIEAKNDPVRESSAESLISVSWRVPHKKKGEQEIPGFNLDYLPPKTHPPVHN